MKNIDWIRNMNSEELAEFMNNTCPLNDDSDYCPDVCELCWKVWLESEYKE